MIQVKIRGELWTIKRENRPGLWGECDWDKCLITLKKNLRLRNRLETLVHELVHALFPDAPESEVEEAGDVIHKVLLADGWGRGKCKPRKSTRIDGTAPKTEAEQAKEPKNTEEAKPNE